MSSKVYLNTQPPDAVQNSDWPIEKVVRWLDDNGWASITPVFKGDSFRATTSQMKAVN